MERIRTTQVAEHVGQRVRLAGWLHALRRFGGVNFIILRDGWGTVQAVTEEEVDLEPLLATGAGLESLVSLEGTVVEVPQAPAGWSCTGRGCRSSPRSARRRRSPCTSGR
jgi:nondiscriminating aspartyl-tRNA synthetase